MHRHLLTRDVFAFQSISALGTLEASIARNMAYSAYEHAISSSSADAGKVAFLVAQAVERRSLLTADLSVQELVDCDTQYDQVRSYPAADARHRW